MNFNVVNQDQVKVVARKGRVSKYQPLIAAITNLQEGEVVVVNCGDGQEAAKLRQNIYQFLRNKEMDLSAIRVSLTQENNSVAISRRVLEKE